MGALENSILCDGAIGALDSFTFNTNAVASELFSGDTDESFLQSSVQVFQPDSEQYCQSCLGKLLGKCLDSEEHTHAASKFIEKLYRAIEEPADALEDLMARV